MKQHKQTQFGVLHTLDSTEFGENAVSIFVNILQCDLQALPCRYCLRFVSLHSEKTEMKKLLRSRVDRILSVAS